MWLCTSFSVHDVPLQDDVAVAVHQDMTNEIKASHGLQDRVRPRPQLSHHSHLSPPCTDFPS